MMFGDHAPKWGLKALLLVILAFAILLGFIQLHPANTVEAGETEPIVNFYLERELFGHTQNISAIAWSQNGLWIASGSNDNTTRIWSTGSWSNIKTLSLNGPVRDISISKNNLRFAISSGDGAIEIFQSTGWIEVKNLTDHSTSVLALDWSPDGGALSSGDSSGEIKIWDTTTWNSVQTLMMPDGVTDLMWSNDGNKMAASSKDGTIKVWNTTSWSEIISFDATSGNLGAESIAWNPSGGLLATGTDEDNVLIWDTTSWIAVKTLYAKAPRSISWGSEGTYLAAGVLGGIAVWDTSTWESVKIHGPSQGIKVQALAMNPQGSMIASGTPSATNNSVLIWGKNNSPTISEIVNLEATEDEPFSYSVVASDEDQIVFLDDTPLFNIDPLTGLIAFTPQNDDVGVHIFTITAIDGKGGIANETVLLTVINVDDPPVPVISWHYGSDYINITMVIGGQDGNLVSMEIEEDGVLKQEVSAEKGQGMSEKKLHLDMNLTSSYEAWLNYSGSEGTNPVAVTLERDGISYTKHFNFDSNYGNEQRVNLRMEDYFKAMGLLVFDATESFDVDSDIASYTWDFGDGKVLEGAIWVYMFTENGVYEVNLTLRSDNDIKNSQRTYISLWAIPDEEDLRLMLHEDPIKEFLESTGKIAAFYLGDGQLKIIDSEGRVAGFISGRHVSEIQGISIPYSYQSYAIYCIQKELKLSFEIGEPEYDYELHVFAFDSELTKILQIYGASGGLVLDIDDKLNSFNISTEQLCQEYSVMLKSKREQAQEVFEATRINLSNSQRHYFSVNDWEGLIGNPKAVSLDIDKNNDGKMDYSIDLKNGMTGEKIQVIIADKGQSSPSFFTLSNIILMLGFVSLAGIGGIAVFTEVGKLALITLILPLYTRIKKDDVLDNEIRGMIRGYIIANPGDNYNSIKRALGLNNGALAYHLRVLERTNIIKSRQDGMFKRFYPQGMKIPLENGGEVSEIQKILLKKIAETPGLNQKEMARMLQLSKGVINYHVKVLLGKKLIETKKKGRKILCYVNQTVLNDIKTNMKYTP